MGLSYWLYWESLIIVCNDTSMYAPFCARCDEPVLLYPALIPLDMQRLREYTVEYIWQARRLRELW
jgi:hypothetical protein